MIKGDPIHPEVRIAQQAFPARDDDGKHTQS